MSFRYFCVASCNNAIFAWLSLICLENLVSFKNYFYVINFIKAEGLLIFVTKSGLTGARNLNFHISFAWIRISIISDHLVCQFSWKFKHI